ncbi:hypothetical protein E2C01_058340 [Portunus trituberculatus]|uniref:Uncharacterized protein n=1 Tax=Portunus trituberculatus TaxID=210409 RepID=A0A5B7H2Q2_PORTR|nr:hypothetical protein [Portunus trituberculatus]
MCNAPFTGRDEAAFMVQQSTEDQKTNFVTERHRSWTYAGDARGLQIRSLSTVRSILHKGILDMEKRNKQDTTSPG